MKAHPSNLEVWVGDTAVWIKISGRANFASSVDFKTLIIGLWEAKQSRFILDLTECLLMDSTFLGVLAGLGLKFNHVRNTQTGPIIELLNANPRISELLENLGISHLFGTTTEPRPSPNQLAAIDPKPAEVDRKEISKTCLEAHQTLMDINPANIPKFKDVAQFLSEDLKKTE